MPVRNDGVRLQPINVFAAPTCVNGSACDYYHLKRVAV